jgi:transcriptional regulator with XRE-family HTH domain
LDILTKDQKLASKKRRPITRSSARQRGEYQALAALIGEVRGESGKTQRDVAERLGQQQSWYAKSESGERRMDMLEVLAILDALEVDPGDFIRRLRRALTARRRPQK